MERRCLKCYDVITPQDGDLSEVDYHKACAIDIFGDVNPPTNLDESFTIFDDNPALRDLTMRLASSVAVLTLPHTLLRGDDGTLRYVEKSTDKESMRMVMDEEEYSANGSCQQVAQIIEEVSTISKLDLLNFWEQMIFCWIAGCNSVGYLEISMHEPHRGLYALTPASEFVAEAIITPNNNEMALTVNRKRHNITRLDFESDMKKSGLKPKIINGVFSRYTNSHELWLEIIDSSYVDHEQKERYKEFVTKRITSLS